MSQKKHTRRQVNGWLIINKPVGFCSTKIVAIIKRYYNAKKVGHAGTLDPLAQGVLPIALGEATKTIQFCQDASKEYVFTVKWGEATDSYDAEGRVTHTSDHIPSKQDIINIIPEFLGEITQTPPAFSAIKVNGQRAYNLARKGKEVNLKSRLITIHDLELIDNKVDKHHAEFKVKCSKGTYIRSLANDIAEKLTTKGHVTKLIRTKVGNFCINNAILLDVFDNKVYNPSSDGLLLAVDDVLDDIPVLLFNPEEAKAFKQGQAVELVNHGFNINDKIVVKTNETLIAIGEVGNGIIKPSRVFNI